MMGLEERVVIKSDEDVSIHIMTNSQISSMLKDFDRESRKAFNYGDPLHLSTGETVYIYGRKSGLA